MYDQHAPQLDPAIVHDDDTNQYEAGLAYLNEQRMQRQCLWYLVLDSCSFGVEENARQTLFPLTAVANNCGAYAVCT